MKLLSHLSKNGHPMPRPADARLLALGRSAWEAALAEAQDNSCAARARQWSATAPGRDLLAAIFGNSPFLSGVAVAEWGFLTRIIEEGADPLFEEIVTATETHAEHGENRAMLMRRLRIAKRRVALLAAIAEFAESWSLEQQMTALSRFAEAAIGAAVRDTLRAAAANGTLAPADLEDPESGSGLIVLAMGKLGGGELNYSSDIDLILLYDPSSVPGLAQDGAQSLFGRIARDFCPYSR
jgi:glutamate-ammonia-ligase adenylyltransferase